MRSFLIFLILPIIALTLGSSQQHIPDYKDVATAMVSSKTSKFLHFIS